MKIGDKISDFTLPITGGKGGANDADGNFTLSAALSSGKFVILYFYPKDDTPGCTIEGRDFSNLEPQYKAAEGILLGISRDSISSHEDFRQKYGYTHQLLSDKNATLCQNFKVLKEKIIPGKEAGEKGGKEQEKKILSMMRSTFIISPDGNLAAEWRDIKEVTGHAAKVLEKLKELQKSQKSQKSSGAA